MKIFVSSVFVDDQDKALEFYTSILGFEMKTDIPVGEYRWLTVGSPEQDHGIQLLLEPNAHPAALVYQQSIYGDGIPATTFSVEDLNSEYERMSGLGVVFTMKPTDTGQSRIAVFDDTCGNLIQIVQL